MRINSLTLTAVALLVCASLANAATVTLSIDASGGNWKLFGATSPGDNAGFASVSVPLLGVSTVENMLPYSAVTQPNFDSAGFSELRSGPNVPIVTGAIELVPTPSANVIKGYGQTAGSFAALGLTPVTQFAQVEWGSPLLIAQGTYTGDTLPTIDQSSVELSLLVFASEASNDNGVVVPTVVVGGGGGADPPVISPLALTNPDNCLGCTVSGTVALDAASDPADSWSPTLTFLGYTQNYGGKGETGVTQPALAPTWDPNTQSFSWDTTGSLRGDYRWQVSASNAGGAGLGEITVAQMAVPEPATLALLGLAAVGCVGVSRRRS